jgi:hypothetical protein
MSGGMPLCRKQEHSEKQEGGDDDASRRWNRAPRMGAHDRPGGRVLRRIPYPRLHESAAGQRCCRWIRSRGVPARTVRKADDSLRLSGGIRPYLATITGLVRSRIRPGPGSRFWPRRRARTAMVRLVGRTDYVYRKGMQSCPEATEQARPVEAGADAAGWAGHLRPARADSACVPSVATRCPTCRGSPAIKKPAPNVERQ